MKQKPKVPTFPYNEVGEYPIDINKLLKLKLRKLALITILNKMNNQYLNN